MNRLHDLLTKTSRTFALSIPYLPDPLRREVTVAYLLFRIADTIEDELAGDVADRAVALRRMGELLGDPTPEHVAELCAIWAGMPRPAHAGYAELLDGTPEVVGALGEIDPEASRIIVHHLSRSAGGMADFLGRDLNDAGIDDLRAYCYQVAGIVGELCTDLFVRSCPALARGREELDRYAPGFGEALQLINIIRDQNDDALDGRRYLPSELNRDRLIELAREDLRTAVAYIRAIESAGGDPGIVAFNALNVLLAIKTLGTIEAVGAGAKIKREVVAEITAAVSRRIASNRSLVELIEDGWPWTGDHGVAFTARTHRPNVSAGG